MWYFCTLLLWLSHDPVGPLVGGPGPQTGMPQGPARTSVGALVGEATLMEQESLWRGIGAGRGCPTGGSWWKTLWRGFGDGQSCLLGGQGRNCFGGIQVLAEATHHVGLGRSHFGVINQGR